MAHRLDTLIRIRRLTNRKMAELLGCSTNYVSGIRNGQTPSLKLATELCEMFPGELTLSDLGIEVDAAIALPSEEHKDA